MLRQGTVAHVLPGGAAVGERLQRAGIAHRRAMENLAAGESALAAHESLEESPAHLANLLDGELTQVGVGLARGTSMTGEPLVYVTEILLAPAAAGIEPREELANPVAQVKKALRRERARLGRSPLRADRRLDEVAARVARDLMRSNWLRRVNLDGLDEGNLGEEEFAPGAIGAGSRLITADAFATANPEEAIRSPHLGDARFQRVGVGVAVAARRLWIAVIYSE
jgi:uncharacterized protein YkwD